MTARHDQPFVWWAGATVWHHFNGYFDAHEERTLCGRKVPPKRITAAAETVHPEDRCKQCERKT